MGALALACAGATVTSCGTAADPARFVPEAGGRSFARMAVLMTAPRDGSVTVAAAGRLLRYRGVDLDGAQVLAGARDRERDPVGRCQVRIDKDDEAQLEDALATAPPDATVQMLDAGDVLVRLAGQTVKMSPRFVPDIVPFVSGVVYDGETSGSDAEIDLGSRDAAVVAFGGQQVGSFAIAAEVPPVPRLMTLAGTAADANPGVDAGAELPLTWAAGDGHGTVTITVARDAGPTLRCRVQDSGHFTIPAPMLARVADAFRGDNLAVAVERSRRSPFAAPGLDSAEVEITTRDVVTLRAD